MNSLDDLPPPSSLDDLPPPAQAPGQRTASNDLISSGMPGAKLAGLALKTFAPKTANASTAPEGDTRPWWRQYILDPAQAAVNTVQNAAAGVIGSVAGVGYGLTHDYGTDKGTRNADAFGGKVADALTHHGGTDKQQELTADIGSALNDSGVMQAAPVLHTMPSIRLSEGVTATRAAAGGAVDSIKVLNNELNGAPAAPQPRSMPSRVTPGSAGAAAAGSNPFDVFTGEQAGRNGRENFPVVKLAKNAGDVPQVEQQTKASILNEVMGPDNERLRPGVVSGNEQTLRNEYTAAKRPDQSPFGAVMADQIAAEQRALPAYAAARVEAAGADPRLIDPGMRGELVNNVFTDIPKDPVTRRPINGEEPSSIADYFRQAKNSVYGQAEQIAGHNPVPTNSAVESLLNDPHFQGQSQFAGAEGSLKGAQSLLNIAREHGATDIAGNQFPPGSVGAWSVLKRSLNQSRTAANAAITDSITRAIDQDIRANAGDGADFYKLGDRIHQMQQQVMESKGMSQLFGADDGNGVKTGGVSNDNLLDSMATGDNARFAHIHDTLSQFANGTLRNAPEGMPEIPAAVRANAQAALNEIHGHLARRVQDAGAGNAGEWNANNVNKVLNSPVGDKILRYFPPDEVRAFHNLNYSGQWMPGRHAYEGAGMQGERLQLGEPGMVEKYANHLGSVAGVGISAATGLPPVAGHIFGNLVGSKISDVKAAGREGVAIQEQQARADAVVRQMQELKKSGVPLNELMRGNRK